MVCTESTTTREGGRLMMAASIAPTSFPARTMSCSGTVPTRVARTLTWAKDSSAEASNTENPRSATAASTWNSRVDLPTPGGPKTSVTAPATKPPPITRSTSSIPVAMGSASPPTIWQRGTASGPPAAAFVAEAVAVAVAVNVFHSAQFGHRPAHCKAVQPQVVQ